MQKTLYVTLLSPSMSRLFKFFKNIKARIDKIQQTKHQRSITVISENNISLKWNLSNTIYDKALTIYSIKEHQSYVFMASKFSLITNHQSRIEEGDREILPTDLN